MSEIMVRNKTTGECQVFNLDRDGFEFSNFCRKAVLDFMFCDDRDCTVSVGKDKYLTVDESSPEPMRWFAACILYMKCVEDSNWGDILDIYQINEEGDEEDEEEY